MFMVPDDFAQKWATSGVAADRAWIEQLPEILATCEQQWDLTIFPPFANLSFNYVAPARRADGIAVVVKACLPNFTEFEHEVAALRHFAGHGAVRLLAEDMRNRALLLEALHPGTPLRQLQDDEQMTSIAASVMRRLWHPVQQPQQFPTIQDWGQGFVRQRQRYKGGSGPFPSALLEEAEKLFAELAASMDEVVLLHGDLHHDNILSSEQEGWLAIDPKGVIGEPAYEVGALLRNPQPELRNTPDAQRLLARRIDQLAEELDMDRARIHGWGLSQAVLSAWWCIEDADEEANWWRDTISVAELLSAIKV